MGAFAIDLAATSGFLVADRNGEVVGRVECPMYGTAPDEPDALAVKAGLFSRRLVTADTIDSIDGANGVIGLRVERESIPTFLWGRGAPEASGQPGGAGSRPDPRVSVWLVPDTDPYRCLTPVRSIGA